MARIQAKIDTGYAKAARVLGLSYRHHRPDGPRNPVRDETLLATVLADFTNAKTSGFGYDKGAGFEDLMWHALMSGAALDVGDYLVRAAPAGDPVYFVHAMPPLKPIGVVLCNRRISLLKGNSQLDADGGRGTGVPSQWGGQGTYWGLTRTPDTDREGAGEYAAAVDVPVGMVGLGGAARGQGQTPSDAPGPSRFRWYLPTSCFPRGSVTTRDLIVDEDDQRYQVSTNPWMASGYVLESIRLEN